MASTESPIVQQRRLRAELRRARDAAGLTQKDVADALEWSTSKLIRIETGAVSPSTTDLKALLRHYGIDERKEKDRFDELVEVGRASRRQAWWDQYRPHYPQQFLTFLGYEASAKRIRQFQALVIPGLLQTPDYARALMEGRGREPSKEAINREVEVRGRRRELLTQENRPEMFFVLDEAVIRRQVGGPDVMKRQLAYLEELANLSKDPDQPTISIQILPFAAGSHPGLGGSFIVFEFPFEEEDYAVLLEGTLRDTLIQNDPEEASLYVETFFQLEATALPKEELVSFTNAVISEMSPGAKAPEPKASDSQPQAN